MNNEISQQRPALPDRTGGAYLPPAKLRALQAGITDKSSQEYQRIAWEALKKSINGLINKVNISNIKNIIPELFSENLVKGRGLFCRSLMKAQAASLPFTPVYAALVAVVNTKFPQIGDLLLMRLVAQFRRAYKRTDKAVCLSVTKFLAHLVNVKVASEMIALQLLTLLLEKPTDDSVEVAVGFMRDVGAFLSEESSRANNAIFERFRSILHEGEIDKRTQYMVEVLFQVRKDKFRDNAAVLPELDLVEDEDQMTHTMGLTDDVDVQDHLNVFSYDEKFLENEAEYNQIKREILGDESEDEDEGSEDESDQEVAEEEQKEKAKMIIEDQTNTNILNLRRAIYLTVMSSLNYEECAHKLLKLDIPPGQEIELTNMIVECCSQEKSFVSFYGLLGERFCRLDRKWANSFTAGFEETYKTIHRFETNRLRNIAKYYSHLLATDAIDWSLFALISLTEEETTSSSRIFLKILLIDLSEAMGLKNLAARFSDNSMIISVETAGGTVNRGIFDGMFPKDHPKNTRFAINYYTSIGLGILTEGLREHLKNAPKTVPTAQDDSSDSSDSSSGSSSDSSSESSSESEAENTRLKQRRNYESRGRDVRESRFDERERNDRMPPSDYRRHEYDNRDNRREIGHGREKVSSRRSKSPDMRHPSRRSKSPDMRHPSRRSVSPERNMNARRY